MKHALPAGRPGASHAAAADRSAPWWRGAAIYQIYPRSFADANGDGVGDLAGITAHLDHVAALGVDAIWISPFFTSPMADFGYDVSDYCDVDPIFGTLADFDALVAKAHALGLRVMVDQVYSHTSDRHPWFAESRSGRVNPKADWYVWADPKRDGSPPSNWQSVFGGPAWTWDARRGQYYMHNFLKEQPQLNCANPAVQAALLGVARFWLERGVDGFRLDAFSFAIHNPRLTNNPPRRGGGKPRTRPFDFQQQRHNQSQPGIIAFARRIRALCAEYGAVFTLAEVGGMDTEAEMKRYTGGDLLDSAYGFDFLAAPALTPALVAATQRRWPETPGLGWPSWAFENHDAPRAISRWGEAAHAAAFARLKAMLLVSLRGNVIVYQGEELGLEQVAIPFEQVRDPEAIANWPLTQSRDGARTPMPWRAAADYAGFSPVAPWLPVGAANAARAVDRQRADPGSLLHLTGNLLRLRRASPALRLGACTVLVADRQRLALRRESAAETVCAVFNFTGEPARWPRRVPQQGEVLAAVNGAAPGQLPPFGALLLRLPG